MLRRRKQMNCSQGLTASGFASHCVMRNISHLVSNVTQIFDLTAGEWNSLEMFIESVILRDKARLIAYDSDEVSIRTIFIFTDRSRFRFKSMI